MTDPDPVGALAAELAELRGQLARTQGEVGYLKARLAEDSGQVVMFRLEVKQLREQLEEAIGKRRLAPPPAPWWVVDEATGRELLAALRESGRSVPAQALPRLPDPASPLLAEPRRGHLGTVDDLRRMGAHLRRRGQPGLGRCPDLA